MPSLHAQPVLLQPPPSPPPLGSQQGGLLPSPLTQQTISIHFPPVPSDAANIDVFLPLRWLPIQARPPASHQDWDRDPGDPGWGTRTLPGRLPGRGTSERGLRGCVGVGWGDKSLAEVLMGWRRQDLRLSLYDRWHHSHNLARVCLPESGGAGEEGGWEGRIVKRCPCSVHGREAGCLAGSSHSTGG